MMEARQYVNNCISQGNYGPIVEYSKQGHAMQLAAPTPDHFLPLLYILGLKHNPEKNHLFNDELLAGSLSMTSLQVS
jgi:4,5-DOPA dioxygenase extradiol